MPRKNATSLRPKPKCISARLGAQFRNQISDVQLTKMIYAHLRKFHINVPTWHHLPTDVVSIVMASAILTPPGL